MSSGGGWVSPGAGVVGSSGGGWGGGRAAGAVVWVVSMLKLDWMRVAWRVARKAALRRARGNEVVHVGGAVEAGKGGGGGVGGVDEVPNGGGAYAKECGDDPWEEDASAMGGAVGMFFGFFGGTLGEDGGCIGDGGGNVGG